MPYLLIIAVLAAIAMGRLYVQHRKHGVSAEQVDEFLSSLRAVCGAPSRPRRGAPRRPLRRRAPPRQTIRHERRAPLDPAQRAAARRRIEARRAGRNRLAG